MFVFQVLAGQKKATREQMLDYLEQTSKGVSFSVSEGEVRSFLQGKFKGRQWFEGLMPRVKFESRMSYNFAEGSPLMHTLGAYIPPLASSDLGTLALFRYAVNSITLFRSKEFSVKLAELHGKERATEIRLEVAKSTSGSGGEQHRAAFCKAFSSLDDASLPAFYSLVKRNEESAREATGRSLDSFVHELGHAVFYQLVGSEGYSGPSQSQVRAFLASHLHDANYAPAFKKVEEVYLRTGVLEKFGGLEAFLAKDFSISAIHPRAQEVLERYSRTSLSLDATFNAEDAFAGVDWNTLELGLRNAGVSGKRIAELKAEGQTMAWKDLETIGGFTVETHEDGSARIEFSKTLDGIYLEYGIGRRDLEKIRARVRLRNQQSDVTDELFARLFDGLVTRQTAIDHSGEKIAPSDSDLAFLSTLSYKGKPMLAREIEAFKQAREKTREEFAKEKKE